MEKQLELNINQRSFLTVLSASIRGETIDASKLPEDAHPCQKPDAQSDSEQKLRNYYAFWSELFSISNVHHVLPLICDTAYKSGLLPDQEFTPVRNMTVRAVMQQAIRTQTFLSLYQNFAAQKLSPVVMKGLICRELYPEPDQRPSSDEDLLIDPSDFLKVHRILLESGLACKNQEIADFAEKNIEEGTGDPIQDSKFLQDLIDLQEVTYFSPQLRIELHISLFREDSKAYGDLNRLFDGALDRAVIQKIDGVEVHSLTPFDHLLYLICHAYKHFLHSGFGIRQICDIELFAEKNDKEIDWKGLRKCCEKIRIEVFTAAVFRIGADHLGGSVPEAFADIETDETLLLLDILSRGVFGVTDAERLHSGNITLEAVEACNQGRRKRGGALASIFLPLNSMQDKYPYLKSQPWALPVAWTQRLFHYLSKKDGAASINPAASLKIGEERVKLLKEYRIID